MKNKLPSTVITACQQVLYITVKNCMTTLLCIIDLIHPDWRSFKNEYVQYQTTASQLDLMLHFDYATLKHVNLVFFGAIKRQPYKSALDLCPDS